MPSIGRRVKNVVRTGARAGGRSGRGGAIYPATVPDPDDSAVARGEGAGMASAGASPPPFDLDLLRGFRFRCRSDCGLCCYAEPRVEPEEADRLLRAHPEVRLRSRGRDRFLFARPNGGACQFLEGGRCRAHALRPRPCREFPLTVHVGRRLQASVVLSCPGIDLDRLARADPSAAQPAPVGLEEELRSLESRWDAAAGRRLAEAERRGHKVERTLREEGRWQPDRQVRERWSDAPPMPGAEDFPVEAPPEAAEGLERLPIYFDGRTGPVALAGALGGWELLELAPEGGARELGRLVPPDRPPSLEDGAGGLLVGYLRYTLERDAFLASVHVEMLEGAEGTVEEWTALALRALGAEVLSRGAVRAKFAGRDGRRLSARDVADGIRATDQDWLDRPTWGDRF